MATSRGTRERVSNRIQSTGWVSVATLVALTLALSMACQHRFEKEMAAQLPDTIAVISGQTVTRQEFDDFIRFRQGEEESGLGISEGQWFREFLLKLLVIQQAEREGITVSDAEVQGRLRDWLPQDQEPSTPLIEQARDFLKSQKLVRDKIKSLVGLEELLDYYQDHEEEFRVDDGAHVLEILVDQPDLAARIRSDLRPGDTRAFKNAAQRHSQGSTAEEGGDLGVFHRGELPEEFERVIFKLKPGEVSTVFHSRQGHHIFMMEEFVRRHSRKFYEVQKVIFEKLTAERERAALDRYLTQIVDKASIQIYDQALESAWRESYGSPSE